MWLKWGMLWGWLGHSDTVSWPEPGRRMPGLASARTSVTQCYLVRCQRPGETHQSMIVSHAEKINFISSKIKLCRGERISERFYRRTALFLRFHFLAQEVHMSVFFCVSVKVFFIVTKMLQWVPKVFLRVSNVFLRVPNCQNGQKVSLCGHKQ